jgi:hypothetical protein
MPIQRKLARWLVIGMSAALLAMAWISTALAEADGDGDGLDGDELVLPILIGAAVLAYVGWSVLRGRSRKPS